MTADDLAPGRCLTRWHDETGHVHALRGDGSPACGVKHYTTTGPYPGLTLADVTCRRCRATLAKIAR